MDRGWLLMSAELPPFSDSVEAAGFSFSIVEPPLTATLVDELMALWVHPDVRLLN